eukprot:TRINITY_DN7025_c0_g1_i1.p1 TRINITY_DN7025_c0_g1~~TRINITY_DN7025_c0_g1_i1.p1  ORF type:complete len:419 (-),score=44.25 TRINITY_DN7025_c0_g1_i1:50-1306(-)
MSDDGTIRLDSGQLTTPRSSSPNSPKRQSAKSSTKPSTASSPTPSQFPYRTTTSPSLLPSRTPSSYVPPPYLPSTSPLASIPPVTRSVSFGAAASPVLVQQHDGSFALQYHPSSLSNPGNVTTVPVPLPSEMMRFEGWVKRPKRGRRIKKNSRNSSRVSDNGPEHTRKPFHTRIIHILSYGNGQWILLTEKVDGSIVSHQTLWTKKVQSGQEPPSKIIKTLWDGGHSIRQVTYGQGKWIVIADSVGRNAARYAQSFSFTTDFPGTQIQKAWQKSHRVSYLSYCDKLWVLITEKNDVVGNAEQRLVVRNKLPEADFDRFWAEGRRIQVMAYGDGQWVVIGEKPLGDVGHKQKFFYSEEFPLDKIQDYYDQDRRIHSICYSYKEKIWALISEMKHKGCSQDMYLDRQFPDQQLKKLKFIR